MEQYAGCQVNLDKGECQILDGRLVDDIRAPCSELQVTFESSIKLTFTIDNQCYITYFNQDWIPTSYTESYTQNGTYHYDMICAPRPCFDFITKPTENTSTLASAMNIKLLSDSQNLKIKCPILNQPASSLINYYRHQSYQDAYLKQDMGRAYFIYFNGSNLLSVTFSKLVNQTSISLSDPSYRVGANIVMFKNEQVRNYLVCNKGVRHWDSLDYIYKMFGRKFTIQTATPGLFGRMYTMKFDDSSDFDTDTQYLCTYTERNLKQADCFFNEFTEIKYVR